MENLVIARAWVLEYGSDCDGSHTKGCVDEYATLEEAENAAMTAAASINNTSHAFIAPQLKLQNRKAVCVKVLSINLKCKTDLYGKPYQPTQHIFTT